MSGELWRKRGKEKEVEICVREKGYYTDKEGMRTRTDIEEDASIDKGPYRLRGWLIFKVLQ